LILAIYTYKGMYGYSEHYNLIGADQTQYRDSWNSVSGGNGVYSSLAGMY